VALLGGVHALIIVSQSSCNRVDSVHFLSLWPRLLTANMMKVAVASVARSFVPTCVYMWERSPTLYALSPSYNHMHMHIVFLHVCFLRLYFAGLLYCLLYAALRFGIIND